MNYTLIVSASPRTSSANARACRFAQALLQKGHVLTRVFFIDRGVTTALATTLYAQDENNITDQWATLGAENAVELTVCSASAARYGVLHPTEAARLKLQETLHPSFTLGGLGLLQEAIDQSDRVVNFNG